MEIGTYFSPLKYHHDISVPLGISMRYKAFQLVTDFELVYSIFYNFYHRRWSPVHRVWSYRFVARNFLGAYLRNVYI